MLAAAVEYALPVLPISWVCEVCDFYGPDSAMDPAPNPAVDSAPDSALDPAPDPFTDADALEEIEAEVTLLAAHIHAATHRLLTLVAEFDRRRGWELGGHRSCAHWLAFRTGFDLGAAREKVRTARTLTQLPRTSAAMQRGELSFSMVRALTRVATPANESDLLQLADGCTAAQLERIVRGFKLGSRESESEREQARFAARELSVFPDDEGMYMVRGRLTPEQGALLMRAVEAASDVLYRERSPLPLPVPVPESENVSAETSSKDAAQRRADALALMAERALAAGFTDTPLSGTRAERYQVLLHVDDETLTLDGSGLGRSELEDGTRVSAETSRRISCDASVVGIAREADGSVLDVGRKTRSVPPSIRRALEARDRGCRFPGCGLRFTDAHHVRHWADGGETKLDNLVLLCAHHHRLVHEKGWKVRWWPQGRPAFIDPRGQVHVNAPPPGPTLPSDEDPVQKLIADTRARGAEPHSLTAGARWKRERDIPDRVWMNALEALGN